MRWLALVALVACGSSPPPPPHNRDDDRHGTLAADKIEHVVTAALSRIRRCYERGLKSNAMGGRLTMAFTIAGDGSVATSAITGVDAGVDACVKHVVDALQFPHPVGGPVDVAYPLELRPAN